MRILLMEDRVEGRGTFDTIAEAPTQQNSETPINPIKITAVEIIE